MKRLALIVAIAIPIVVIALALPSNAHRGKRGWKARGVPMAALELSVEQRSQLEGLELERAKQMAQLRADLKVARLDLRATIRQDAPDPAEVKARVNAVNNARSLILESRVNHRLKVNSVLSPEQRNKLREIRRDRSQKGFHKMWRKDRSQNRLRGMGHPGPDRIDDRPSSI